MTLMELIEDNPDLADLEIMVLNPTGRLVPLEEGQYYEDVVDGMPVLVISYDE